MPERPDTETSGLPPTAQVPAAGRPDSGGEGEDREPFPYFLRIGDVYDGPLDLLLTLIKKQNLDICDLPIAKVTAQFQAYARTIPPEEVETAAEFVYMASQLILIKSRMLLPTERAADSS